LVLYTEKKSGNPVEDPSSTKNADKKAEIKSQSKPELIETELEQKK
jgi:hypothetical protein